MNPVQLAGLMSYETAGTMNPTKAGPVTQHGRHRGLIQFGEPQARKFGVKWDDPINSQLGSNGAVERYLRASGYKTGMPLVNAYATINAGNPYKTGASDANNGGAPGNVRDKVASKNMQQHLAQAKRFMGGYGDVKGSSSYSQYVPKQTKHPLFEPALTPQKQSRTTHPGYNPAIEGQPEATTNYNSAPTNTRQADPASSIDAYNKTRNGMADVSNTLAGLMNSQIQQSNSDIGDMLFSSSYRQPVPLFNPSLGQTPGEEQV
jgi:hypothetical protein